MSRTRRHCLASSSLADAASAWPAWTGTRSVSPSPAAPAIVRAIDAYKEAGLRRFVVVVGQMASR